MTDSIKILGSLGTWILDHAEQVKEKFPFIISMEKHTMGTFVTYDEKEKNVQHRLRKYFLDCNVR